MTISALEIRNLTINRAGKVLISGFSLKVPAGEIFTLMGIFMNSNIMTEAKPIISIRFHVYNFGIFK